MTEVVFRAIDHDLVNSYLGLMLKNSIKSVLFLSACYFFSYDYDCRESHYLKFSGTTKCPMTLPRPTGATREVKIDCGE